jgi:hypothetical protein
LFLGLVLDKDKFLFNGFYGALAKIGSFGFAEGSACGQGKAKCAVCGL